MKNLYFVFLLIIVSVATQAQSLKKSFKLIDEKQFDLAATELAEVMAKDSTSPQLWYGLALLNSDAAYASSDLFYAWNCINKSITLFSALNEKEQNKFGESLNITLLNELRTQIDDKLFKQVSASSNMELFLKHLNQCHGSRHTADVELLRNALAFKNAEKQNTIAAYNTFIADYPPAKEKEQAIKKRNSLAFQDVLEKNSVKAFQQFMIDYPGSAEYQRAFDLRNELMLDSVIALNAEKPIKEFISNIKKQNTKEHIVDQALIDRANSAIQKLTAKDHWIVFLSQGNLFKMNEADFQKQQLTTAGNIFSFKCTEKGDIVYTTVDKNIMRFFVLTQNNRKICEFKAESQSPEEFSTDFSVSDNLDIIYIEFSPMMEYSAFSKRALWRAKNPNWQICSVLKENCTFSYNPADFSQKTGTYKTDIVCLEDVGKEFYVSKVNDVPELFSINSLGKRTQLSRTSDIPSREEWGSPITNPCFSYIICNNKIVFSFIEASNDYIVGPTFIVNSDGTNQMLISRELQIGILKMDWLNNENIITIVDGKLTTITGDDNHFGTIANDVTQFDLMYVAPMDSFCFNASSDENVGGVIYTAFERNIFRIQGTTVTAELYSSYSRNGSNAESSETEFSGTITDNKIVGNAIRKSYLQYGTLSGTESIPMEFIISKAGEGTIEIDGQLYQSCK